MALLTLSSFIIAYPLGATSASPVSTNINGASTYGVGLSGAPVVIDVYAFGGSPYSKANMEKNITEYLVPAGVHLVFIDTGWENAANATHFVAGGFSQSMADWLSLGEQYNIDTIFFTKQLGYFFGAPSWDQDLIDAYPSMETVNDNGTMVPLYNGGSVIQSLAATSTSAPVVITLTVSSGKYLVVAAACSGTGGTVYGITDTLGLTYRKMVQSNHNHDTEIWLSKYTTTSDSDSIAVSWSGSCSNYLIYVYEVSGSLLTFDRTTSTGFGSGSSASVSSYLPKSCNNSTQGAACDDSRGTGSFVLSFATSSATGSCSVNLVQFENTNPNNKVGGTTNLCGSLNKNWGYSTTTAPITVPSGTWDEVSVSFGSNPAAGGTTSSGWSMSNPIVYSQYEQDIKQLVSWYGQYTSWIGFGEGATGDNNNYALSGSDINRVRPFDNFTIQEYADSVFFQRLINPANGKYLFDDSISKIWEQFVADRPDVGGSSGIPFVYPEIGYGASSVYGSYGIFQRFYVPFGQTLNGFKLKAVLSKTGAPPNPLVETTYEDNTSDTYSGRPVLTHPLESHSVTVSGTGWVTTDFASNLIGGEYYWVGFTTTGGNLSNFYSAVISNADVFADAFTYESDASPPTYGSLGLVTGSSVLWIQSTTGQNITIYPLLNQGTNWAANGNTAFFQPTYAFKSNEINLAVTDRAYDRNNVTVSVKYPNGTVLATGTSSEMSRNGVDSGTWQQVQLSSIFTLEPSIRYSITFSSLPGGDKYGGSSGVGVALTLLTDTANPSSSGYLGQSSWPIFSFGLQMLEPPAMGTHLTYSSSTDLQDSPGVRKGSETALEFTPSSNGNLQRFSFEVQKVLSFSNQLNVSLRANTNAGGTGDHPLVTSLAYSLITESSINATFKTYSSGTYAWANATSWTGNVALTSGTKYWLVINATHNSQVVLQRMVNPIYQVYVSPTSGTGYNNFATSWGVPGDGPTDLSFQIVTSTQSINNAYIDVEYASANYNAQSFQSGSNFQLKGLWIDGSAGIVSIYADSGSDSPGVKLTSGTLLENDTTTEAPLSYVSFDLPLNITSGTKYWIVTTGEMYASRYRSDMHSAPIDYGGSSLHYETSANGTTWTSPTIEGDAVFLLVGSTAAIHTYSTKTLSTEIINYGSQTSESGESAGWNAFLLYWQSADMVRLTTVASELTNRQMYWYTGLSESFATTVPLYSAKNILQSDTGAGGSFTCPPNCPGNPFFLSDAQDKVADILSFSYQPNLLPWSSYGDPLDNRGDLTPTNIRTEYLTGLPLTARTILTFNDFSQSVGAKGFLNMTQQQYTRSFGTLLNRMQVSGTYFGYDDSAALKVLWIGTSDDGFFPEFLTSAINMTIVSSTGDQNLTALGNLRQFNVIVNPQSMSGITSNLKARIISLVKNGGGLVSTIPMSSWEYNIMGLAASSGCCSTPYSIISGNKITSPYTSLPGYSVYYTSSYTKEGNESAVFVVQDAGGRAVISSNSYFSGYGVYIAQPYARLEFSGNAQTFSGQQFGSPRDSYISLLINAIYYSAHEQSRLPILWETNYDQQQNWSPYLQYSIDGTPGRPVLLWLSSNDSSPSPFDIHLNATFYGISTKGWVSLDVRDMSVIASGSGSDVHITATIPPKTWLPIYLLSRPENLEPVYSTAGMDGVSLGATADKYATDGPYNASSWLVLSSSVRPVSVSSSELGQQLPAYASPSAMNSSKIGVYCTSVGSGGGCDTFSDYDQQGWYYDQANSLLYVHYQSAGPVTITVSPGQSSSTTSTRSTTSGTATKTSTTSTVSTTSSTSIHGTTSITTSSTSSNASTTTSSNSLNYLILSVAVFVAAVPAVALVIRFRSKKKASA